MTAVATTTRAARLVRLLLALVMAATVLSLAALPADEAGASNTTTDHIFSDPNWYPLRNAGDTIHSWDRDPADPDPRKWSGLVSCVKTNCPQKPNDPHGVWAIDWIANKGDAVHAAGWGILHVGANPDSCGSTGEEDDGKWVWIDHGGGLISRYHHLHSVVDSLDGKNVSPRTVIGTVGSTGKACDGTENYLHFQVRRDGLSGDPYDFGQMKACDPTKGLVLYPRDLPLQSYSSWDDIQYRDLTGAVPATTNDCIPAIPESPERLAKPGGGPGDEKALVRWGAPTVHDRAPAADSIVISRLTWRPSKNDWGDERWTRLSNEDARKYLFTGLINGRKYRYRVAYHNSVGHGNWSPWKEIKVGAPPNAPTKRRISTGPKRINFGWYKPDNNGYLVTGYDVGIRRAAGGSWTAWETTRQPLSAGSYKIWEGLRRRTTYQVRVRARSAIGPSAWSSKFRAVTD